MGFSLCMHRVDGRQADLPLADLDTALKAFHSMPWKEEIAQWKAISYAEELRPVFIIYDDAAHALHVMQYDEDLAATYSFPARRTKFGLHYEDSQDSLSGVFPHEKLADLFFTFFLGNEGEMMALLAKYPVGEQPNA